MTKVATEDDFFQVHTNTKSSGAKRRVYIGGLPRDLPNLKQDLEEWMYEKVPNLAIESITVNTGARAPHALIDCGIQSNLLISKLHQQVFHGKKLTVQRERRNNNKKQGQQQKKQQTFKGWSKPKQEEFRPIPVDEATENIRSVITDEIRLAEEKGEDTINVALASTAAVTLLATMNGFSDIQSEGDEVKEAQEKESNAENGFQLKDMSELLADFGQADPNWQKQHVDLETTETDDSGISRLAPKGKAPIHIIFNSFGFLHGAPKRQEGWSHSQPLAVMDCRDLFESVPKHLEWQTGLSGVVKRVLQQVNKDIPIQQHAKTKITDQVWDCLLEAQNAGYGYSSPLEMTIYIGSELGKHRSVVLCEWAATGIRKKLRQNQENRIQQPVSVETYHRDVERQRNNAKDGKLQKNKNEFAGDW